MRRSLFDSFLTHRATRAVVLAAAAVAGLTGAQAQFTTARLNGFVTDGSGSVVPGAKVTIRNDATGYMQTVSSDGAGQYLFPSLPVGTYQLTVMHVGFGTYTQLGLVLAVGQSATQKVVLGVSSVATNVQVTANASLVTTDNAEVGQVIGRKDIVNLPLNGRDVQQLVFLMPGAQNVTANYCAANCEGGVLPTEQYAKVNGAGANGVNYLLDGVDYNDTYINANLPFPSPDAIEEFNLVTGNMSAAYGNAIGAVVNVVTRSGTNRIHGTAFEFVRNNVFDAADYFSPIVNPLHQNQFGGTLGGPILKDHLFYFLSYQGTRFSTQNNGQIAFVPNAAERTGDFSDLEGQGIALNNPYTGAPYGNNQVPVSPVSAYLLRQIPLPNGANDQLTFNGAPDRQNTDEYLGKLDWNIGRHHISGRYFQMHFVDPPYVPADNLLQVRSDAEDLTLKNVGIVDLYTISPRVLLSSYFGYNSENGDTLSSAPFNMQQAGSQIAVPPDLGGGKGPVIYVATGGDFTIPSVPYGIWDRGDQSLREVLTTTRGNNELQIGGEVERIRLPMGNQYLESGEYSFTDDLTGDNLADFEVGSVSDFTQGGGLYLNVSGYKWSLFVQDDWKATPRLTLNLGLRWDPFYPYKDSEGRVACFVPGAQSKRFPNAPAGLLFGGSDHDAGCPASSIYANPYNFAPRLGFAYQLTADGKTSLRGGAGYYYQPPSTVAFEDAVGIPPFAGIVTLTDVDVADPYGSGGISNPFPAEFGPTTPPANASFPSDITLDTVFDRHFRLPMVLAYNLTFERGLGRDWLVRAAYVGNDAHHLSGTGDQENGLLQLNPAVYVAGQSTEDNTQQRRIYPNFGPIYSTNAGVNSNYNAGQVTLERRFDNGFSMLTNFTWAKALDQFAPFRISNCSCGPNFDYGPSDDDVSKTYKLNGDYSPHWNLRGIRGRAVNGWELTAILNWNTGTPFSIFSGFDNSFSGLGADRADFAGIATGRQARLDTGRSHTAETTEWFNTQNFQANAVGTFGDTGKNILRGPRYFDTDLAAIKTTELPRNVSLELRAEAYNVFNNVNFGNPDNTVTDTGFGTITGLAGSSSSNTYGTAQPRILQFGAKVAF